MDQSTFNRRRTDADNDPDSKIEVLIVDDDENYRTCVGALARRIGYGVGLAADGESGWNLLTTRPFDLLLIDFDMPRLNGLELISRIRMEPKTRNCYALMVTGRDDLATKITALSSGFDDFIIKTAGDAELVAKLLAAGRIVKRQQNLDMASRQLYNLATRDELTGVHNRHFFAEEGARLVAQKTPVAVVLFDLDDFKMINDTFGHVTGDAVLRGVGGVLRSEIREGDLAARFGGDEFILVAHADDSDDLEGLAHRIAERIRALRWTVRGVEIGVDVSTGVASSDYLHGATIEQLLGTADRDLYKNKWIRKNPDRDLSLYEYPQRTLDGDVASFPQSGLRESKGGKTNR